MKERFLYTTGNVHNRLGYYNCTIFCFKMVIFKYNLLNLASIARRHIEEMVHRLRDTTSEANASENRRLQ